MSLSIDWIAFVQVFLAALFASVLVVGFYSLGLRLLVRAGRVPVVEPRRVHRRDHRHHREGRAARGQGGREGGQEEPADRGPAAGRRRRRVHLVRHVRARGARRAAADRLQPLTRRGRCRRRLSACPRRRRPARTRRLRRMDGGIRAVRPVPARAAHDPAPERHAPARGKRPARRALRHGGQPAAHARRGRGPRHPPRCDRVHRRPDRPRRARGVPGAARRRSSPSPSASAAPVIWVAGNHDERPALRRDLLASSRARSR